VLKATRLIKTGEVIEIAHVLNDKMPFAGTRRFDVHTKRTFMISPRTGAGATKSSSSARSARSAPSSTASPTSRSSTATYNCFKTDEISSRTGFTKLGIEKVGTLMTPRRPDRRRRAQGRRHARRCLRDHSSRSAAGPAAPESAVAARRTRSSSTRAGTSSGPRTTRANKQVVPGIGVAAAEWLAKQTRCSSAPTTGRWRCRRTRPADLATRASDHAGRERHPHPREPESWTSSRQEGLRIRLRHAAAEGQASPARRFAPVAIR